MGLKASGDEFCIRTDEAFKGLDFIKKIVDDGMIQAPDYDTLFKRIRQVLQRCREHGITISKEKLMIGEEIKMAGFIISSGGVKADPDKVRAIADFPAPQNLQELRSFLGLANQLGMFIPDLAQATEPLRALLKRGAAYAWTADLQEAFDRCKVILTSDAIIQPFDHTLPTDLLTDASKLMGLGYMLLQRDPQGKPRIIQCGSRSLSSAEKNYAPIELECLAIQWAVAKCNFYLAGIETFKVVTDHRPLLGIFKKSIHEIENPRLKRLYEKLMPFPFTLEWNKGKNHEIADALSRAPVFPCEVDETEDEEATASFCYRVAEDPQLQILFDAVDEEYRQLAEAVRQDNTAAPAACLYKSIWSQLNLYDNEPDTLVIMDSHRIVVPPAARSHVLALLHKPHAGITKTREAARQLYFWPGINNDISQMVSKCQLCHEMLPSQQQEPMKTTEVSHPMEAVGVDLFDIGGKIHLVMVDRFSGFPFTASLKRTTTEDVTKLLEGWFLDWGFPKTIRSDGGPQFRSKFTEWCAKKYIKHETSSPYNPCSNGLAEAGVKNMKTLLKKCQNSKEDFGHALLAWRNTPRADGISPAYAFLGRHQRGVLPRLHEDVHHPLSTLISSRQEKMKMQVETRAKPLPQLSIGLDVSIQDPVSKRWNLQGCIRGFRESGSIEIETSEGKNIVRNRRFVRPLAWQLSPEEECTDNPDPTPDNSPPRRSNRIKERADRKQDV